MGDGDFIPIMRPQLGDLEAEAVRKTLESGWVTQGPQVETFEQDFAAYTGARFACAVSSCTAALHMALMALGIGRGDEVITVSHSFIATANAITYTGATPVFVDINLDSLNMDETLISAAITSRTKAILCVHQVGMPSNLESILAIAEEHGLRIIEDAACATGSQIRIGDQWEMIGKPHGDIACFSFHPRKLLTTGDGGMLTTDDPKIDEKFRLLRHHGMSISDVARSKANTYVQESYDTLGFNYRLTDIQAAIGRVQLERLPEQIEHRRRLAERYFDLLGNHAGIILPREESWQRSNWQSFCVRVADETDRDGLISTLLRDNIATRPGIMCAHREPVYSGQPLRFELPHSEKAQDQCIQLPLFGEMSDAEQDRVAAAVKANVSS